MRRVGVLIQFPETDPGGQARIAAFREELQKLGWRIGGNLQIDYRWAVSTEERARSAAAELLELTPDVISANSTVHLRAVQQATRTVPIVFTTIIEPIGPGLRCELGPSRRKHDGFFLPRGFHWGQMDDSSQRHCPASHARRLHVQSSEGSLQRGDLPFRSGGGPRTWGAVCCGAGF